MKLKKEDVIQIDLDGTVNLACKECPLQSHTLKKDETPTLVRDTDIEEIITPYCVRDNETCVHFDSYDKLNETEALICYFNK